MSFCAAGTLRERDLLAGDAVVDELDQAPALELRAAARVLELGVDGLLLGLLVRRDAGVERDGVSHSFELPASFAGDHAGRLLRLEDLSQ